MNRPNLFASNGLFKPPSHYLGTISSFSPAQRHRSPSLDDSDIEAGSEKVDVPGAAKEEREAPTAEYLSPCLNLEQSSAPLLDYVRSSSPSTRSTTLGQPGYEQDAEILATDERIPLIDVDLQSNSSADHLGRRGGMIHLVYGMAKSYSACLIYCLVGCQSGVLLANNSMLKDGSNKFTYPLTLTLMQLIAASLIFWYAAVLTHRYATSLQGMGLGYVVAHIQAPRKTRATRHKVASQQRIPLVAFMSGWGVVEWDQRSVKHALPTASLLTLKLILSTYTYAYTILPSYMVTRIAIVPLTLLSTTALLKTTYSVQTISSAVIAALGLLLATASLSLGLTRGLITAGVLSSVSAALYPIALLRTYRQITSDLVPQGQSLVFNSADTTSIGASTKAETTACWRTLHYVSILSVFIALPSVVVSGEIWQIHHSFNMASVPWFWAIVLSGSVFGCGAFCITLLLVKATSPLTVNVMTLPTSALLFLLLGPQTLAVHNWVGICSCWVGSLWYMLVRAKEANRRSDRQINSLSLRTIDE